MPWLNWDEGQPDNVDGAEECLAAKWRGDGVLWSDERCYALYCVACERY